MIFKHVWRKTWSTQTDICCLLVENRSRNCNRGERSEVGWGVPATRGLHADRGLSGEMMLFNTRRKQGQAP